MTDENRRWSDDELSKFHEEFLLHQEQEHFTQKTLTEAVDHNTRVVTEIRCNTQDILHAWNNAQGALRVVAGLGRFVTWTAGIMAAVGVIWYTITHGAPPSK